MAKRVQTETTYEVYLLEGRHWQLHARYRDNERNTAVAEAKDLERRGEGDGVKVVREVFYPDYNKTDVAVVFVGKTGGAAREDLFNEGSQSGGAASYSGLYIAWRIILITVFSLGFGIMLALATSMFMAYMGHFGLGTSDPNRAKGFVFAAFFLGVIAVALPMLVSLFVGISRSGAPAKPAAPPPKAKPKPRPKARSVPEEDHGFDFDFKEHEVYQQSFSVEHIDTSEDDEQKASWWSNLFGFGRKDRDESESEPLYPPASSVQPTSPQPGEEAAFSIAPDEEEEPEPQSMEEESEAIDFEQHRMSVMRFLGGAISVIKKVRPQLDAYTKFAFDLVLAGACEAVAQKSGLGEKDKREILKEAVEMIGTKADLAQAFAEKYESYFAEERYKQMAQLGMEAMGRFMAGDPDPFMAIPTALDAWDKPQMKPGAQQSIMTIFFTDMVGSTDMTQEKGDFAAQEIVRRHNAIVRSALAEHGGREIKHTGDGIMATCPTAPSALQACIDIQRAIASFNATNPPIPLEVRIGLNAGEPIVEENDLFGATVQLAARVCAYAQARQIVCSQSVFDLSMGKAKLLTSLGAVVLKGFKEPMPVYDVRWNEAPARQPSRPEADQAPLAGVPLLEPVTPVEQPQ